MPSGSAADTQREHLATAMQYGDVAHAAAGVWGRRAVDMFLVLTQFGFCVGYFIFLGNTMHDLTPISTEASIAILFGVTLPCTFITDLRRLSLASTAANVSLLIGFVAVLVHVFQQFPPSGSTQLTAWSTTPIFFGIATRCRHCASLCKLSLPRTKETCTHINICILM
eukprot:m.156696 g.156696  ORF g.156696 m.156696 type:complete len:168 (+) comp15156_c0_seq17:226-729(+)